MESQQSIIFKYRPPKNGWIYNDFLEKCPIFDKNDIQRALSGFTPQAEEVSLELFEFYDKNKRIKSLNSYDIKCFILNVMQQNSKRLRSNSEGKVKPLSTTFFYYLIKQDFFDLENINPRSSYALEFFVLSCAINKNLSAPKLEKLLKDLPNNFEHIKFKRYELTRAKKEDLNSFNSILEESSQNIKEAEYKLINIIKELCPIRPEGVNGSAKWDNELDIYEEVLHNIKNIK